jgi:hypothetical protein
MKERTRRHRCRDSTRRPQQRSDRPGCRLERERYDGQRCDVNAQAVDLLPARQQAMPPMNALLAQMHSTPRPQLPIPALRNYIR